MPTLVSQLEKERNDVATLLEEKQKMVDIVNDLGLGDIDCQYAFPVNDTLCVYFNTIDDCRAFAKRILPLVGKLEKSFNEYSGNVVYSGKYKDVGFKINSIPTNACEIRVVEEEQEVTEIRKVKKYQLIGNCDPLLEVHDGK